MSWNPPENYTPAILLDLFPATVTIHQPGQPDTVVSASRLISTAALLQDPGARLFIFEDSPSGPAAHSIAIPLDIKGSPTEGYTITLGDPFPKGSTLTAYPDGGCGCGSKLKSFKPFSTMRYTAGA